MADSVSNIELELTDGTACAVVFSPGAGAAVSKQGQSCGSIDENELGLFASRRNGAMELAVQVEAMLGQQALTTNSQDRLMDAAYLWFQGHF
jgi:hypothetical protein